MTTQTIRLTQRELFPVYCAAVLFAVASYTAGLLILQQFPNSADEFDYLYQAHTFSSGNISNPTHPNQEFLSPFFIIEHEGKVFSIFPPGWSLFLTVGVWLKNPWVVNPILAGITVILLYFVARHFLDATYSWVVIGFWMLSPMVLLNSASLYSHPCCSFLTLLSVLLLMKCQNNLTIVNGALAGLCMILSFCTRELTSTSILLLPVLYLLYSSPKRFLLICYAMIGVIPIALYYGWYCSQLTGTWFYPPRYLLLDEYLGFGWREIRLFDYVEQQYHGPIDAIHITASNGLRLLLWNPLFFPALSLLGMIYCRKYAWMMVCLCSCILLMFAYSLYPSEGGSQYGARFYYEGLPFFAVTAVYAIKQSRFIQNTIRNKNNRVFLGIGLTLLLLLPYYNLPGVYKSIYTRRDLFRQINHKNIDNAIVFIASPSGDMTHGDLVRNLPDYQNAPIIFAWDLAHRNQELVSHFPNRDCYRYTKSANGMFTVLIPYDP